MPCINKLNTQEICWTSRFTSLMTGTVLIYLLLQDTLKSTKPENKVMKKANVMAVSTTTIFYLMCGCFGYAAFGNNAPGNLLTGFGFYEPFWLVNLANVFIVVHLVGAYQVSFHFSPLLSFIMFEIIKGLFHFIFVSLFSLHIFCSKNENQKVQVQCIQKISNGFGQVFSQPIFSAFESWASERWPKFKFVTGEYPVHINKKIKFDVNFLRLIWRTLFVIVSTILAMAVPFFNDLLAFLGALGFWPLTVFFPVEMYITQKRVRRWTCMWIWLQIMSVGCFLVGLAAACGSIQGLSKGLRAYKPFEVKE